VSAGGLTYTPDADYCNSPPGTTPDTFSYTLNGGSTATVSVAVTCADDPPVAVDDPAGVSEDSGSNVVSVLGNDTDIDGGPISVESVTQPANGTVVNNGGDAAYTPNANYCNDPPGTTPDTFSYTLNGGSTATVSVTVTCVDDPAGADDDTATVDEDSPPTPVDVLANDGDPDGGAAPTISSATDPANGSVVLTGGSPGAHTGLTYEPDPNYCNNPPGTTPDTFTYTISSGATATVSVTVTCEDDPPVAVGDSPTVFEDSGGNTLDVLANDTDIDSGPIFVDSVTQPANGTVVNNGTDVGYTPNAGYCNSPVGSGDTFTYTLNGGSTATVSVTVTCVDDPPVAVDDSAPADEDTAASTIDVLANDTDGDGGPISVASVSQPANGTVAITGGGTGVSYAPTAQYCNNPPGTSPDTFTYTLNGGSTATVSVTVTCAPDDPAVDTTPGSTAYTEDSPPVAIDAGVTVTDFDAGAIITGATIAITNNFAAGQDVLALSGSHPGITAAPQAGNTLTLSGTASPSAYQAALQAVTYSNPSQGPSTLTRTVTFTVTDDTALSGSATKAITVAGVNDPPTAVDDTGTTDEDTSLNVAAPGVLANDTDVDPGDTKTVVALNGSGTLTGSTAEGGNVTINANGSYTYTPPAAFQALSTGQSDTDSFQYTMADGAGAQSAATVNLTVNGVSDAPTAVADSFDAIGNTGLFVGTAKPATDAGRVITGSVLANDTDPDSPSASLVAEPVTNAPTAQGGTITIESDGNFTYHPDDVDTGVTDTFTYRVCDASPCNSGTVANATGTLSLPIAGQVWYVRNNQAAGGDGTSDTPFDTLAEAEGASQTGDTVYVFDGDNTSTGLDTGYAMEADERLIGEHSLLSVDPDGPANPLPLSFLFAGTPNAHPTLTTTSAEDVVSLAAGAIVVGVNIDPGSGGGGIGGGPGAGGPAASSVQIANVNIIDTGTLGTQPGLELNGTTLSNSIYGLVVNNGGSAAATGVRLLNAGSVFFDPATLISITTSGAKALDAGGTSLTSQFDDITVTGSGTGGVAMTNTPGTTTFTNLSLTTTSGTAAAFALNNAGAVTVSSGGTSNVSATGGPAIDVAGTSGATLAFDDVDSTASTTTGISLNGLGAGTFSANGSSLVSSATGTDFNLVGGTGGITYDGTITDNTGQLVNVQSTSGGLKDFNGSIGGIAGAAGGNISLSGNTGATIRFDGGVNLSSSGATPALSATGGGTLAVTGTNKLGTTTSTGPALSVLNTTIHDDDLNFESVRSLSAANGVVLNTTGNSNGRLFVNGTGGTCSSAANCTGGAIQGSTGAGIELTSVPGGATLTRVAVTGGGDDGIRATTVHDVDLSDSVVLNNGNSHAGGAEERGLDYLNVTATPRIVRTTVSGSDDSNAHIRNTTSTASALTVDQSTFSDSKFNAGLRLRGEGSSVVTANVTASVFSANADPGFSMQTDSANTASQTLLFDNNDVSGGSSNAVSGRPQVSINVDSASIVKATVSNNDIKSGAGAEVILNTLANHTGTFDAEVIGNDIGDSQPGALDALADGGSSIWGWAHGDGITRMEIRNNTIANWGGRGMELSLNDGTGDADYTVTGNVLSTPDVSANTFEGIYIFSGGASGDASDVCVDMENNDMDGIGRQGVSDIALDRFTGNILRFADFNDTSVPNLQTNLRGKNPLSAALTVETFSFGPTATTDTACDLTIGTP
ncbi:MAG TPA: Ig-like domain-containing protein, partial [Actinomycetota bacterium]|nr:Ig-like domain-containing protein [Actinomycetota bacterium]